MLYRTLMAALSYLPNPLLAIKLPSVLFDYIGAGAAALLAHEVCLQAGRTRPAARRAAAAAGIAVLFLPSVVMNGGHVGAVRHDVCHISSALHAVLL